MTFHWPQITWFCLMALGDGMVLAKHGEPTQSKYNVFASLAATALMAWLLWEGGFFS